MQKRFWTNSPKSPVIIDRQLFGYSVAEIRPGQIETVGVLGYLKENWNGIYRSRGLRDSVAEREVLVVGNGGIEKSIDLILCRRFKGKGMGWSWAGAQNLLKLRLLRYDRNDGKAFWRRRVN